MTTKQRFRAALLIAIDPLDLQYAFRRTYRTGCARCGGVRDAHGPKGLRACCSECLEALKHYRVYGAAA
ncbi:MAG TPA: hypothetical protein VJU58_13815 [Microbacterium sp.]|nr:hypothetical protein [Microbacterium sp.]